MDKYLEELVRKHYDDEVDNVEADEIAIQDDTAAEGDEVSNDESVTTETIEENDNTADTETIVPKEQPAAEENNDELSSKENKDSQSTSELDAINIRVYNSPSVKQVSRLISGRVIILGKIDNFTIVQYMKHGFGLVKGYTLDI